MIKFIKHAFSELEHVVWPTAEESKKYMIYTVGVIIIMATLLAILGYTIRTGLVSVRGQFDHAPLIDTTVSGEDLATEADLEKLQAEFAKKKAALSGATVTIDTGSGASGNVVTPNTSTGTK